ncbi:progestin and adipoq receptor family member 3 [Anaeramoeba flamelloides]|uniref:Progestin and adipoq receptor family member 3 n=1 Tax=Anaeramoeba flamelloides TaxID=1746091 RepID=A0ABQ8X7T9_9EUKA|nr:progestin and adipoq receptor family member 3 [Anaeramoeba flamelloides]
MSKKDSNTPLDKQSEKESENILTSDSDLELPFLKFGESLSLSSSDRWDKIEQSTWDKNTMTTEGKEQEPAQTKEKTQQPHQIVGRIYDKRSGKRKNRPTWERHLSDSFSYDEDIKHTKEKLSKYKIDLEGELDEFAELKSKHFDPSDLSENEPRDSDLPQDPEKKTNKFQLHTIYTAPLVLGYFRHIERGYRVYFTIPLCFKSAITRWHNETINIGTHLFGGIFFLIMLFLMPFLNWYKQIKLFAKITLAIFTFCTVCCLLFSAIFHILKCHSISLRKKMFKLDINGIIIQEIGLCTFFIYYSLKESPTWRMIHLIIYISLGVILSISYWTIPALFQNQNLRSIILSFFAIYGFIPLIQGGFTLEADFRSDLYIKVAIMYMFYALGLFVFITKIPERYTKNGYFDYIGASHQIWHLLVLGAALWILYCGYSFAKNYPDA